MLCSLKTRDKEWDGMVHSATGELESGDTLMDVTGLRFGKSWANDKTEIPLWLRNLTCLEELDFGGRSCFPCSITRIPVWLAELTRLKVLNLDSCGEIMELPASLSGLVDLETLNLDWCMQLQVFPHWFGQLTALKCLSLAGCGILTELPREIQSLHGLALLSLRYCSKLETIPSWLENCSRLSSLDLSSCGKLRTICCDLKILSNLACVNLANCTVLTMPELGFRHLIDLNLSSSWRLDEIPTWLSNLTSLQKLNLGYNDQLREFPDLSNCFTCLRDLSLQGCKNISAFSAVPRNLISINLMLCAQLEVLPSCIGNCVHLRSVNLNSCGRLTSLPKSFSDLSSLTSLDLGWCKNMIEFPDAARNLSGLTYLDISGFMNIGGVSSPLLNLTSLNTLVMNVCPDVEVLPASFTNLTLLTCLDLDSCPKLRELPEWISRLAALSELNLPNCNELTLLPASLGALTRLRHLCLSDCKRERELLSSLHSAVGILTLVENLTIAFDKKQREQEQRMAYCDSFITDWWSENIYPRDLELAFIKGRILLEQADFHSAIESFEEILHLARKHKRPWDEGAAFCNLASVYLHLGQAVRAIEMSEKSLEVGQLTDDVSFQSRTNQGIANHMLGEYGKAFEIYNESLEVSRRMGGKGAEDYMNLGLTFMEQGEYGLAIQLFETSLELFNDVGEVAGMGTAYLSLGLVYHAMGNCSIAIKMFETSLEVVSALQEREDPARGGNVNLIPFRCHTANVYGNLGMVYASLKQYDRSIAMTNKSLEITMQTGDPRAQGSAYGILGEVYSSLGQYDSAIAMFEKSLDIKRSIKNVAGECSTCNCLGIVFRSVMQYEQAVEMHERALAISTTIGDLPRQFSSHRNLGIVHMERSDFSLAVECFEQALLACESVQANLFDRDVDRISLFEQQRQCYVHYQKALLKVGSNMDALAISERSKARSMHHTLHRRTTSPLASCELPPYHMIMNDMRESRGSITRNAPVTGSKAQAEEAITWDGVAEMVRKECAWLIEYSVLDQHTLAIWLVSSNGELRSCRVVDIRESAISMTGTISMLIDVSLCGLCVRGRYAEIADDYRAAGSVSTGDETSNFLEWMESHRSLLLNWIASIIDTENLDLSAEERFRDIYVSPVLFKEAEALLQQHGEVCDWLEKLPPKADEDLRQDIINALQVIESQILGWKDLKDLTLERLHLEFNVYNPEVRNFLMQQFADLFNADRLLRALHSVFIEPIQLDLPEQTDLIIVPDMQLAMVPWAALKNAAGHFIVESYPVRLSPSLSVSMQARFTNQTPFPKAVVVGNPWPLAHQGFSSLPHAEGEAMAASSVLRVRPLIGPEATKTTVQQQLTDASFAHLACHGWLERQSLVLCPDEHSDGLLTMHDVQHNLRLARGSIIILSACNTGAGLVMGEGVVGISRAFLLAGAGAVVMSLWSLPDHSTKQLMEAMYCALEQGHQVEEALRFAMLMMLRHGAPDITPFAWAGFVVMGSSTRLADLGKSWCRADGLTVDEMCAVFERCGLDCRLVQDNGLDHKTFITLSDDDIIQELSLTKPELDLVRTELARTLHRASPSAPAAQGNWMDDMEAVLVASNPTWVINVRRGAAVRGRASGDGTTATDELCGGRVAGEEE